jgi:hypothetical protein
VAVVLANLLWPREREPVYKGKKLSEWIGRQPLERPDLHVEAIRSIGTNAVPFLVKWIGYESPAWRKKLTAATKGLDIRIWELLGDKKAGRATYAVHAFAWLGPEGSSGIPDLLKLVRGTNSGVAMRAVVALSEIGLKAVPALLDALTNQPARGPFTVYWLDIAMAGLGTNGEVAVPAVLRCVGDKDGATAATAATWLGNLKVAAAEVVPALSESMASPDARVRNCATAALANFRGEARSAIPALVRALGDTDGGVRVAATNTLLEVAPELLRGSGTAPALLRMRGVR